MIIFVGAHRCLSWSLPEVDFQKSQYLEFLVAEDSSASCTGEFSSTLYPSGPVPGFKKSGFLKIPCLSSGQSIVELPKYKLLQK